MSGTPLTPPQKVAGVVGIVLASLCIVLVVFVAIVILSRGT